MSILSRFVSLMVLHNVLFTALVFFGLVGCGRSVTSDTTPPNAPVISSPVTGVITNDATPTFSGTAEAGSTVEVFDGVTSIGTCTATGGNWTLTPTLALGEGAHSLTAKATDAAANTSGASTAAAITVDTVLPTAPGTPTDEGAYADVTCVFNWTTATDISGSGVASYIIEVGTSAGANNVYTGNVGNVLTYTVDASGHIGQTLYARVRAIDVATNTGPWSGNSDGVLIDNGVPAITAVPATLTFTANSGGPNPLAQQVDITNSGSASSTLRWTAAADKPWLQVSPFSGTTTVETDAISVFALVTQTEAWMGDTSTTDAPTPRRGHSAVWTGAEMIVWGGYEGTVTYWPSNEAQCLKDGYAYDPATDTWSTISGTGAPTARLEHSAVWTGTEMIVWGGTINGSSYVNTGGRFDPATGQWQAVSTTGAPTARFRQCAVWTGNEMIIWGGGHISGDNPTNTGKKYYPSTDTWGAATSTTGAPSARYGACAVWTGSRMIVWGGGYTGVHNNDGASYDPTLDSWTAISNSGAPSARIEPSAVWTGDQMIVWGGEVSGNVSQTGGIYDVALDTWVSATTTGGAPTAREWHSAIWTGKEMIVWGGRDNGGYFNTGKLYVPPINLAAGTYTGTITISDPKASNNPQTVDVTLTVNPEPIPAITALPATLTFTANASGPNPADQQIDVTNSGQLNSTLRWQATTDRPWLRLAPYTGVTTTETDTVDVSVILNQSEAWTGATSTTGAPNGRENTSAVWTGAEMIVWGGFNGSPFNTGAKYDPATDTWLGATSVTNAPSARWGHSAVWTGRAMIVWGGSVLNTGALYDPVSDMWTGQTTVTGAPSGRRNHSAVWTGSKMIVFGGTNDGVNAMSDIYTYDSSLNSWAGPLSPTGTPPTPRWSHTAVWTGGNMIVWGGYEPTKTNTGVIYDPVGNTWLNATQTTAAPIARGTHSAIWTGTEMIVWGGDDGSGYSNTGGLYNPISDTWVSATTTTGALSSRRSQQAIWTGKEMILWGGYTGGYQNTGAKYVPQIALSSGAYDGTITICDPKASNNPQTVDVTLTVNP